MALKMKTHAKTWFPTDYTNKKKFSGHTMQSDSYYSNSIPTSMKIRDDDIAQRLFCILRKGIINNNVK